MNLSQRLICCLLVLLPMLGLSQGEAVFNDDIVHEVRIEFSSPDFWNTLTNNYDNYYPDVPYIMVNATIDGEQIDSIGVRLKGFSSYFTQSDKKSIKLDFNEYVKGKRYDGLKKLNLNNGEGDPAFQRDIIAYDLMRRSGVAAPRTSYSRVYLNDEYWGLYLMVEQVDKVFLSDNFGSNDGNLFKNMDFSDLSWFNSDTSYYQRIFDLKTDENPEAWESFVEFLDILNNTSDQEFKEKIDEVFDVELYLRVLMVDVALENWDSYIEHGRNFYIYEHPTTSQFSWIPWDYNLSMGGNFSGFDFGNNLPSDLAECESQLDGSCPHPANDPVFGIVVSIYEDCCLDTWSADCQDFYEIVDEGFIDPAECLTVIDGSCPYPSDDPTLLDVMQIEPSCCEVSWDEGCQELYDDISSGFGGYGFPIDMSDSEKVLINRIFRDDEDVEAYYSRWCKFLEYDMDPVRMFPEIDRRGDLIRPHVEEDEQYLWSLAAFESDLDQGSNYITGLKKFIENKRQSLMVELDRLYTCPEGTSLMYGDLVVNEFCASCDSLSGIADANGDFDDWIELYNNTTETIDLSNAFLSDNLTDPAKWAFPAGTNIAPDSYLIIWADEDLDQDGLHADFKLSKDGESITLTVDGRLLDSVTYGPQVTNQTEARIPNGTGQFTTEEPVTFNANNDEPSGTDDHSLMLQVRVFPNPAQNKLNVIVQEDLLIPAITTDLSLVMVDPLGRPVLEQPVLQAQTVISLQEMIAGIHSLHVLDKTGRLHHTEKVVVIK